MSELLHRLFDPLLWVVLGGGVVVWKLRGRCGEARRWYRSLVVTWACGALITLPVTSRSALWLLERQHPPVTGRPAGIDSIVVLGGGIHPLVADSEASQLSEGTTRRCLRAAELYRDGPPCPVIVCGGIVHPDRVDRSEASVMRGLLVQLGVAEDDVLMDEQSRNTWENGVEAARLLEARSLRRPALVTEASHLPRAVACFRAQRVDAVPVGCGYRTRMQPLDVLTFVPSSSAPLGVYAAIHELVGFARVLLRGR